MKHTNRREFLRTAGLIPLIGLTPGAANALFSSKRSRSNPAARTVVLVELKGGNDSFNTLVPYRDDNYYRLRPKLALRQQQVLKLRDNMGMNKALKPLLPLWKRDEMAWIQGIGFSGQGKSHFSSIDVWHTATNNRNAQNRGWLSQVFNQPGQQLQGIAVDNKLGPMVGAHFNAVNLRTPEAFAREALALPNMNGMNTQQQHPMLAHLGNVQNKLSRASQQINQTLQNNQALRAQFPAHAFGEKLSSVARMILSGFDVPVYQVGLGNFDTHVSQQAKHQWLLNELAQGLAAFSKVMKAHNRWDDVIVLTYSEFGRAAGENYSMGTDHGSTAAHMVLGGQVRGGRIYGKHPNLDVLHGGQPDFNVDFRAVYGTLANRWWQRPSPWGNQDVPFIA